MVRVGNEEEAEWISVASFSHRGVHPWLCPSTFAATVTATMILFSLYCNRDPHELLMHHGERGVLKQTMFVKVHMEGYRVGRKIDVKAHESYESLSHAIRKMFHNFLSNDYNAYNPEEHNLDDFDNDFVLLFEDHDGDRMLVADVPWKLFINTVKRLYIVNNPKALSAAEKNMEKVATSSN